MMRLQRVVRSRPVVFAPVRAPNVDFGFIREYNTFSVAHCPILILFGPSITLFHVGMTDHRLPLLDTAMKAHRL